MRYVQINSFYNGSTGIIMRDLHKRLQSEGVDSYIFWGRRHKTINDHEQCCASLPEVLVHGLMVRLTGRMGFYSKWDTARLLKKLDDIDPDVVHLHNIHGYYINIEMLFKWLASHRCRVKWTLHDCWALTGYTAYVPDIWSLEHQMDPSVIRACHKLNPYPKTFAHNYENDNLIQKQHFFTLVPPTRMTLITPSYWLAHLVKRSILSDYPVQVCHNQIDQQIFHPVQSDFRERFEIGDRFMILGVASPWSGRKGLGDFIRLSQQLNGHFAIVLVGLNEKQKRQVQNRKINKGLTWISDKYSQLYEEILNYASCTKDLPFEPSSTRSSQCRIIPLKSINSQATLAKIYSAADLFVNPTLMDNYPTVNLEAQACGTPVLTYDTGGSKETLSNPLSRAI